ncbi:MAG TPA: arylsulfotransferase family protein [Solirubrobacteraceae bacterium]|nr:arylsulfotransferase family protein [Solirubrobacteraceae bacterium]
MLAAPVLAACGSGGGPASTPVVRTTSAALAPSCLGTSSDASARLGGTNVEVSPMPGSGTANPATQISFLGAPAAEIRSVSVSGSASGPHAGELRAYSQGDGASFIPATAFAAGEKVTVRALIGSGTGKAVSFAFHIDTPYPTSKIGGFANRSAAPGDLQAFYSLPGVRAPVVTVTAADRDTSAGDLFTTEGPGPGAYGAMIFTPRGRLVWFHYLSGGRVAEDLNVQDYHGAHDLTLWQGKVLIWGFGDGEDLVLDSSYRTVATVRAGNGLQADLHEFQIEPHDIAYVTAFNPISCNLSPAGGTAKGVILDTAIEAIDMRTGLVRWEWHGLDHVPASQSQIGAPNNQKPWDWFHINSIDLEADGNVLISARNTWAAYQIQAGTGRILWRLGGLNSSFKMGHGTPTAWQHDARMLPDGNITIFDDGSNPPVEPQSRAITVSLDLARHTATLVSSITHPTPLLTASQGNVQTLPNGNLLVDYGGVPEISEYSKSGSLLFDAHLPYDMASYRGYRYPWSARPYYPPAVAASLNNTGEETIVHASWNGATGVASWRVLAGADRSGLRPQSTVAAGGFETEILLTKAFIDGKTHTNGYVAVQALDASGHVLGASQAVAVESFAAGLKNAGA